MRKELQELRNQGRAEDHSMSATESSAETVSSSMQDEDGDDFQLSSFTVELKGVVIDSSVATEAFIVFAEYMRPRLPVIGALSAQAAYESQPFLFWTIVAIVLCRLPEQHNIALFQLLRAPLSLHLGLPCPIESELDFSSIHAFLRKETVPPAYALEVRIQLVVAKFTALLNHELTDGTSSSFLRLFDTELDALKNEMPHDEEAKSIVEYAILDAKIHIYTLVITKFSSYSPSRQILLRTARDIALRIVDIGTRAIRNSPNSIEDTTAVRRERCQPKDRHRCLAFSTIFLLKFFIRQNEDPPEEKQIVANHVAMTQTLCRACTIDSKDEFSRVAKVFEVLGREGPKDEDKTKLVLNHRMGVSLLLDAVNTAGEIRGRRMEMRDGEQRYVDEEAGQPQEGHADLASQVDGNTEFAKSFWSDPYTSLLQFDPASLDADYSTTW
ncbi:hypothetical protein ACHAQD_012566 [Fusarium lateritium]